MYLYDGVLFTWFFIVDALFSLAFWIIVVDSLGLRLFLRLLLPGLDKKGGTAGIYERWVLGWWLMGLGRVMMLGTCWRFYVVYCGWHVLSIDVWFLMFLRERYLMSDHSLLFRVHSLYILELHTASETAFLMSGWCEVGFSYGVCHVFSCLGVYIICFVSCMWCWYCMFFRCNIPPDRCCSDDVNLLTRQCLIRPLWGKSGAG